MFLPGCARTINLNVISKSVLNNNCANIVSVVASAFHSSSRRNNGADCKLTKKISILTPVAKTQYKMTYV